jgi:uncharacterized protein (DUF4415 family)
MAPDLVDDAPDLSTPEWREKFAGVAVRRGRPKLNQPKNMTTNRLDRDVLAFFQKGGPGWQTRINDALRAAMQPEVKKTVGSEAGAASTASASRRKTAPS